MPSAFTQSLASTEPILHHTHPGKAHGHKDRFCTLWVPWSESTRQPCSSPSWKPALPNTELCKTPEVKLVSELEHKIAFLSSDFSPRQNGSHSNLPSQHPQGCLTGAREGSLPSPLLLLSPPVPCRAPCRLGAQQSCVLHWKF